VPGKAGRHRDSPWQVKQYGPRGNTAADVPGSNLQLWRISRAELGPRRRAGRDFSRLDRRLNGGNGIWNGTKWYRPTCSRLMAGLRGPPMLLKALQHNCVWGEQVMEAVLESAVKREVDLVLIQEPWVEKERDSTRSHPSFTFIRGKEGLAVKCWIAVNKASRCRVMELKDLAGESGNHVQVVEVTLTGGDAIVIANIYDQHEGSEENRPAQWAPGPRSPGTGGLLSLVI